MAAFQTFDTTILDLALAKHDFSGNTFKFMLTNAAPSAGDSVKADITEISAGNGYSAGGVSVDLTASESGGALSVAPDGDKTFTASGGTIGAFRYVVLYNDTTTNKPLVSYYDYGSSITLNNGETLTLDVGATILTGSLS